MGCQWSGLSGCGHVCPWSVLVHEYGQQGWLGVDDVDVAQGLACDAECGSQRSVQARDRVVHTPVGVDDEADAARVGSCRRVASVYSYGLDLGGISATTLRARRLSILRSSATGAIGRGWASSSVDWSSSCF